MKSLVDELKKHSEVIVVSPHSYVPFFLRRKAKYRCMHMLPYEENYANIKVYRPRYVVIPKIEFLNGIMYAFGIFGTLKILIRSSETNDVMVHSHSAYPDAVGSVIASTILKLPIVTTVHGSDINVMPNNPLLSPQIRFALNHSNGIIAVSKKLIDKIKQLSVSTETRHIPCAGYDPATFISPRKIQNSTEYRIIFIGNLVKIKGTDILLRAIACLEDSDNIRLDIIGDGPELDKLKSLAQHKGIEKQVIFHGAVHHEEIPKHIQASDLLCLPSYNEGTPNVIIESLACGTPVLATRVGAIPDIVNDANGITVNAGDVDGLAEGIKSAKNSHWNYDLISASVKQYTWPDIAQRNYEYLSRVYMQYHGIQDTSAINDQH